MVADFGEQKTVRGDPTGGFQHGQRTLHEIGHRRGRGHGGLRGAEGFGLGAKAAQPELAALIRHGRWCRRRRGRQ